MTFKLKSIKITVLTNSDKFKLRYLDHRQFKVIGDQAADFNFYLTHKLIRAREKGGSWQLFQTKLKVYMSFLSVFSSVIKPIKPDNVLKLQWDVVVFLILLINIFYIPLKISFDIANVKFKLHYFQQQFEPQLMDWYVYSKTRIQNFAQS